MKTIEIKGIIFELQKPIILENNENMSYLGTRLEDCYNKPSYRKQAIYEDWENWYYQFDYEDRLGAFTVYSYNTTMFTLTMAIRYNGKEYHLYITPSHNYIYEIIRK